MRILFVNPPEYSYMEWVFRNFNSSIYRLATYYRKVAEVKCLNMRPETYICYRPECKRMGQTYVYKEHELTKHVGNRACGNWENEHLSRPVQRLGFPNSVLVEELKRFEPDTVMVSGMFTYNWEGVKEVIDTVRKVRPEARVVIGGIYPTLCREHADTLGADEVYNGRLRDVDFTYTEMDLFEDPPYAVDVITSLGCPNECGYCAVPTLEGHRRVRREPELVVDEIVEYYERGVRLIRFLDSNLLCDYKLHFQRIIRGIIRAGMRNLELTVYGGVDATYLDRGEVDELKTAGFKVLSIPLESSSKRLLERWNRRLMPSKWQEIVRSLKGCNLLLTSFVLGGCWGQTIDEVKESIKMVEDEGVMPLLLFFTPIPGTDEWKSIPQVLNKLEMLHPLLFPFASNEMKVSDLNELLYKYSPHVTGTLAEHPEGCRKETLPYALVRA